MLFVYVLFIKKRVFLSYDTLTIIDFFLIYDQVSRKKKLIERVTRTVNSK